jgi:hypothetical protein
MAAPALHALGPLAAPAEMAALCRRFHVRRLDLFGSAARGAPDFDPKTSDLDLLVEFEPLDIPEYGRAFFGLKEAIETATGRSVDLLTLPSLRNPFLRQRIEQEKRPLYPAAA